MGGADPLGLRPVSEADLRVYQQASNGALGNALAAAGSWVADNWEYIAAGAVVVAGIAVMCTGVGGPLGAAMISGALMSAGSSIGVQKFTTGSVDWGQVALDGFIGAAGGVTGGAASAAAGRALQGASCLGRNIITGAVESGVDGAVSGGLSYLTGPGPHTVGGFAAATAGGGGFGGVMGGAGGALSKATGVSRYGCFTADTPVLMADGTAKPIGQVAVGERVVSHDPVTGEDVEAEVEATHVHHDVPTLEVTTTAGTITTTSTHPFYVQGRGWTPAADLRRGDRLKTPDNTTGPDPDVGTANNTAGPDCDDDTASTIGADAVPTGDGEAVAVLTIQPTGRTTTVHNLTVRGTHNYHVLTTPTTSHDTDRTAPILVHNNGPCDDDELLDQARRARDELVKPKNRKTATVTAGYTPDGRIAIGRSSNPEGCAEEDVIRNLGVPEESVGDVRFTEARRPRTGKEIPICHNCQERFDPSQFPPDVQHEPGGRWDGK